MAQQMPVQKQQRAHVRVDDTLPLAWRRIDDSRVAYVLSHYEKNRTFPPKINDINSLLGSLDVHDALRQLESSDPVLTRILGRLDQKLNLLLRLFHPSETERPMALTMVNISGGGISFLDRNPELDVGDMLELRLALSVDSLMLIECMARVMKVAQTEQNGLTQVACRFEPILDQDRERVIQYIFKRQSELLRAKRGY
ncbi:MAG: PilZ domain-containing protein [Magnetococcus sp. YQC-5]